MQISEFNASFGSCDLLQCHNVAFSAKMEPENGPIRVHLAPFVTLWELQSLKAPFIFISTLSVNCELTLRI